MGEGLILASKSERRQELLKKAGISYRVVEAEIEEVLPEGVAIERAVVKLARDKAAWVAKRFPEAWVLAADTVVALGGEVFQKPGNPEEAAWMLLRLSGKSHEVFTGYCLQHQGLGKIRQGVERTVVTMRSFTQREIERYVKTGEPLDKAGAYAIQGRGAVFVTRIYGSYTNVVGLPLAEVVEMLMEEGVALPWGRTP